MPPPPIPNISRPHHLTPLLLLLALCLTPTAHPQGCSQCRETVGQTPARTQQAYRRGITILILASAAVASAAVVAIKRFP